MTMFSNSIFRCSEEGKSIGKFSTDSRIGLQEKGAGLAGAGLAGVGLAGVTRAGQT
jgi:hypothetical protein